MDKRSLVGFILIAIILALYPYYIRLLSDKGSPPAPKEEVPQESQSLPTMPNLAPPQNLISPAGVGEGREIKVITPLYRATISTRGGVVKSWRLLDYPNSLGQPVELIPPQGEEGLRVKFYTFGGELSTSSWIFSCSQDSLVLSADCPTGELKNSYASQGLSLVKTFKFRYDLYSFDLELSATGVGSLSGHYLLEWPAGMNVTERDSSDDLRYFASYSLCGGEVIKEKIKRDGNKPSFREGETQWVAAKSKYFLFAAMPLGGRGSGYGQLGERGMGLGLQREIEGRGFSHSFRIYLGPLDYFALKSYGVGLERAVGMGEGFLGGVIGPISVGVLWFFVKLHGLIPQYGLVLIVFSLLMKLLFYPLTHKSLASMRRMQKLQPKLAALKERYKKNPQKLNQEMMKLYREHGVNPLGGCLPLLLQIPVFWALFQVFRSTIELRGERFLWVRDLSRPDLVGGIPVLAIIMGITMFIQQKQSVKDPKQKAMVYLMPILFIFLFKSFPAGLVLYWTVFNILTIGQQYILEKMES